MNDCIYMPNEIFSDLKQKISSLPHIAFAYSYYFLTSYMYRNCVYAENRITQAEIKQKLGYAKTQKMLDYIIKKRGVLDELGYTETTGEYPVMYSFDEFKLLQFKTNHDLKLEHPQNNIVSQRNYKIKFPVKCFHRTEESASQGLVDGTFYEVNDTHCMTYEVFEKMMQHEELGAVGFYIFGYLKHMSDIYDSYQCCYTNLTKELGIKSNQTLSKYTKLLEQEGYITVERQPANVKKRVANLYTA